MFIRGLLDNDQYKFTMQQAILKLGFTATPVVYKFKCRNEGIDFRPVFNLIKEEINILKHFVLTKRELEFMKSIRYFSKEYLQLLKYFKFDPDLINVSINEETGELDITIKGGWFQTILYEVPILSIVSQAYMSQFNIDINYSIKRLHDKLELIAPYKHFRFRDFGTRRRESVHFHDILIRDCKEIVPIQFKGTSNLYLSMKHHVPSFGTMAHEWLQAHQQLGYRVADSQKMALENWIKVYRGDLGIALADVINTDAFLKDFDDPFFYKLFDGVREDSEPDPKTFGHKIINFYLMNKIDPLRKTIVFSNSLDFEKALKLYWEFHNLIGITFGIGTYLTNDNGIVKPLNIVLKMVQCNGQPVAKISNSPGKGMCESPEYIAYLKSVFGINT